MKKIIIIFLILFLLYFFAPTLIVSFVIYQHKISCEVDVDCWFDINEKFCMNKNWAWPKWYDKINENFSIECKCSNILEVNFCSKK